VDKALAEALQEKRIASMTPPDPNASLPFYRQRMNPKALVVAVLAATLIAGLISAIFGG
jgi:hypothetical protein